MVTRIVLPTADASAPAPSATFANYFGTVTVDGAAAQDGLLVEVFTKGGTLVGKSATTQGWYPYTRVFGADAASNPPVAGAAEGEELVFKVGGRQAAAGPAPVKWKNERAPERVDLTVSR